MNIAWKHAKGNRKYIKQPVSCRKVLPAPLLTVWKKTLDNEEAVERMLNKGKNIVTDGA